MLLMKDDIKPDPKKVEAINNWLIPQDFKQLQSFLGSLTWLSHFIPDLAKLHKPLQQLTKKDVPFMWMPTNTEALETLKLKITNDCLIQFFDPKLPVYIEADASKQGLRVVLLQPDNTVRNDAECGEMTTNLRPVTYAAKSLSDVESHYANIERELLGVIFSLEKAFKHFVYSQKCTIITDHKPLTSLFRKCITNISPHLDRMLLRISDYDFNCLYLQGKKMFLSDTLSHLASHNEKDCKESELSNLNVTIHDIDMNVSDSKTAEIQKERVTDPDLQLLMKYIIDGWPLSNSDCVESVRLYFTYPDVLCIVDGMVLKGNYIIIPHSLCNDVLTKLHTAHVGITKTMLNAHTCIFWSNI